MDPASPEKPRPGEAMADVPRKPSRGHCGDGLLHRPNAHVRCSAFSLSATTGVRSVLDFKRYPLPRFELKSNARPG